MCCVLYQADAQPVKNGGYHRPVTSGSPLAGRRVGLVLGAGGMIGHAYHAGVLAALEDHLDWDARDADLVVGTSAGSVVGSALRAGIGARDLAARSTGDPLSPEAARLVARSEAAVPGGVPLRPRRARGLPRMAAPGMVARTMLRPFWWNRPGIVLAGAIPAGRVPTDWVSAGIRVLYGDEWSDHPLWIAAGAAERRTARRVRPRRHRPPTRRRRGGGVVRDPGLLRAGHDRRRPLRRRRRALPHERRPGGNGGPRPRRRELAHVDGRRRQPEAARDRRTGAPAVPSLPRA